MTLPNPRRVRALAAMAVCVACLTPVASLAQAQPAFSASFDPNQMGPGSVSRLAFEVDAAASGPATDVAFSMVLPAGLTVADTPDLSHDCQGVVTAAAGGDSVTLAGGRVAGGNRCEIAVNVTAGAAATYNAVSGDLTSSAGNSGSAAASLTVGTDRPGFSLSLSPSTAAFGGLVTATYTLDNSANAGISFSLGFLHALPPHVAIASTPVHDCPNLVVDGAPGDTSVSGFNGFLMAGATCTITLDLLLSTVGTIEMTTGVLAGGTTSGRAADTVTVPVQQVALLADVVEPAVAPGEVATLRFTLINFNRRRDATDLAFSLDLDAALSGLTAVGLPVGDPCGSGSSVTGTSTVTLNAGLLAPDSRCTFEVLAQVPAGASHGDYPLTTSSLSGVVGAAMEAGLPASDTLTVAYTPTLDLTAAPDPVQGGDGITLGFTLENPDPSNALSSVSFAADLNAFMPGIVITTGLGPTCGGVLSTGELSSVPHLLFSGGSLAAGASCMFQVDANVPINTSAGPHTLVPSSFAGSYPGVSAKGSAAPVTLQVLTAPTVTLAVPSGSVLPGGEVPLEVRVSMPAEASDGASDMDFDIDLDSVLSGLVATSAGPVLDVCGSGSSVSGSAIVSLADGALSPGEHCTFQVPVTVPGNAAGGNYTLASEVGTALVGGVPVNLAPGQATLRVTSLLTLTMAFIDDPAIPGETVTLAYTLENRSGTDTASAITFDHDTADTLSGMSPAGLPIADPCGAGSQLSQIGTGLRLTGGSVPPASTCTFQVTLNVPANAAATSHPSATSDVNATLGAALATFPGAVAVLEVGELLTWQASADVATAQPGQTVGLTFSLANGSALQSLNNLAFTLDLDGALAGLVAVGLPANDGCGSGSSLTGTSTLSFAGGSLAAGDTCDIQVDVQVPAGASRGGPITLTTGELTGGASSTGATNAGPASAQFTLHAISLTASLAGPVVAGEAATLSVTVENLDSATPATAMSLVVDLDALLPGLTATGLPVSDVCGAGSSLSGTSSLGLRDAQLAAAGSCAFDVQVVIPANAAPGQYRQDAPSGLAGGISVVVVLPVPSLVRMLDPDPITVGEVGLVSYAVDSSMSNRAVDMLAFADSLPAGLQIADPPNAGSDCGGAVITANAGERDVTLTDGDVAAFGTCEVWLDVVGTGAGTHTWASMDLDSSAGTYQVPEASIAVNAAPVPDAGVDAGPANNDAGVDAGPVNNDAGVDAGPANNDAGVDAGPVNNDAGVDAGPVNNDAGSTNNPPMDAGDGMSNMGGCMGDCPQDAGEVTDGGSDGGGDAGEDAGARSVAGGGGCGCHVAGQSSVPAPAAWLGLALCVGARLRRRRRRNER